MNTTTRTPMQVAAPAASRARSCFDAFASHAWSAKAIAAKAMTAYGAPRLGTAST